MSVVEKSPVITIPYTTAVFEIVLLVIDFSYSILYTFYVFYLLQIMNKL